MSLSCLSRTCCPQLHGHDMPSPLSSFMSYCFSLVFFCLQYPTKSCQVFQNLFLEGQGLYNIMASINVVKPPFSSPVAYFEHVYKSCIHDLVKNIITLQASFNQIQFEIYLRTLRRQVIRMNCIPLGLVLKTSALDQLGHLCQDHTYNAHTRSR